jgi:arsenate reductase
MTAHWGMADPAAAQGSDTEVRKAFLDAFITLHRRIQLLLSLPIESLDSLAIQQKVREIGTK